MDHSSVMYASRKIEQLSLKDPALRQIVASIGEEFGRRI
jgi:chromosomal replication initiation ATPase DnaA